MKNLWILFVLLPLASFSQRAEVMDFEAFEKVYLDSGSDSLLVINFWATWCIPCVKELPYFEKARKNFQDQPVKILLVSLDFINQLDSRLNPFIQKREIGNTVILLDAPGEHIWIPKIDERWSGAVPATLIVHPASGCKNFYEKPFSQEELNLTIQKNIEQCIK